MKTPTHPPVVVYLFDRDLRLEDNAALDQALIEAQQAQCPLLMMCLTEPWMFVSVGTNSQQMGGARYRFWFESLMNLKQSLHAKGHDLHVHIGCLSDALSTLQQTHAIQALVTGRSSGLYEHRRLQMLPDDITLKVIENASLFHSRQLPFSIDDLPKHFTPFRKKVEDLNWIQPKTNQDEAWLADAIVIDRLQQVECLPQPVHSPSVEDSFEGGEQAGNSHLIDYMSSDAPSSYKQTRNAMMGWSLSTKFSPWLALGCLSPRQIMQRLRAYEAENGANDSTYWIYFELLWREFFHWNAIKQGRRLFHTKQAAQFDSPIADQSSDFQDWCAGTTGEPLIDACMRELNQTGFLTNRGRQIAASYLIHELQADWRAGAYYFEQQLIDYDVASNWGNWQYIAGVGADPRGGRHFNVKKQQNTHDPDGAYRTTWSQHEVTTHNVQWQDLIKDQ